MLYDVSTRMTASRAPFRAAAASESRLKNGRAKANTMIASAASRIISRNTSRMRRRRTDWYGMRRRNISDGNSTTRFRSRWIRCTMTGTERAPSATSTRGATKPTRHFQSTMKSSIEQSTIRESAICNLQSALSLPCARELLARGQIGEERVVERHAGVDERVVDAQLRELRAQRLGVLPDERPVLLGERLGHDGNLLA